MNVFVIAMEKEAAPVLDIMRVECEYDHCEKRVVCGKIEGKDCAIIICGVGKVNAAMGAQIAIERLNADKIINIGFAGGLSDNLNIGGIYEISKAVQFDFDLTQLNGTKIGTLDECEENYIPLSPLYLYPKKNLATADRFNDSNSDFELLKSLSADIRDMEGGAIAQVCMHAKVTFHAFKIISDIAKRGSTTEQYLENIRLCASTLGREIKKIVSAL